MFQPGQRVRCKSSAEIRAEGNLDFEDDDFNSVTGVILDPDDENFDYDPPAPGHVLVQIDEYCLDEHDESITEVLAIHCVLLP